MVHNILLYLEQEKTVYYQFWLGRKDLDIISYHVNVVISVAKPVIVDLSSMNYNMV